MCIFTCSEPWHRARVSGRSFLHSSRFTHVTNLMGDGNSPTYNNYSVSSENNEILYLNTKLNFQILQIVNFYFLYVLYTGGSLTGSKAART
jgi:hypothetical protein